MGICIMSTSESEDKISYKFMENLEVKSNQECLIR